MSNLEVSCLPSTVAEAQPVAPVPVPGRCPGRRGGPVTGGPGQGLATGATCPRTVEGGSCAEIGGREHGMATTVADVMVETLKASGVQRVYGIPGDSLNGFTDALRRDGTVTWQHTRHEEAAAFAAAAEAALTRSLAVCVGSCGPGNLHLINGLYDANRSGVPVLAIAAHIPTRRSAGSTSRRHIRSSCSPSAACTASWPAPPSRCRGFSGWPCARRCSGAEPR